MAGVLVERETLAWLIALGRKIEAAQVLNPGFIGKEALRVMPRFLGDGLLRWFILAEDLSSTTDPEVYVWPGTMATGVTPTADTSGEPIALVNVGYCLSPSGKLARAGYYGTMANIGGRWIPISTYECLSSCASSGGSIAQPTFTDATVGLSYSFSIATTGTVTGLTISNLPAGLSASGSSITGTPTTAGHKWVTITGTSGDCTITKLAKLTVLEAA